MNPKKYSFGMYCQKYNFVYVRNAKTMSTSIMMWILALDFPQSNFTVHDLYDFQTREKMNYTDTEKLPGKPYTFTFVREPFSRLVSAYLDVFVNRYNTLDELFRWGRDGHEIRRKSVEKIREMLAFYRGDGNVHEGLSFSEFIDYICRPNYLPFGEIEGHWRAQHVRLNTGSIKFDFIGKYESNKEGFELIYERLNIPESDRMTHSYNRSNKGAAIDGYYGKVLSSELKKSDLGAVLTRQNFMSQELEANVFKKYEGDYHAYGYECGAYKV